MLYRVHDAGDGKFEIQRFEPVTIGVMYDEAMADLLLAILETDDDAIFEAKERIEGIKAPVVSPEPPPEVAEALPEIGATGLHKIGGEMIERVAASGVAVAKPESPKPEDDAPAAEPEPAPQAEPVAAPDPEAKPEPVMLMHEAFQRIDAGEKLGVVADDLGLKMPMVRAAYARRARAIKEEADAYPSAPREQEECRLCGREFVASIDSDGLCGRCARGM